MSVPWYLMAKGKGGGGYKTASGPIVSVNDALAAPLRSLVANIDPVQEGTGDPSPDNVRPISGWSAVNVWRTRKNLFDDSKRYVLSGTTVYIGAISSDYTIFLPAGNYTISVDFSGELYGMFYREVNDTSSRSIWNSGSYTTSKTFTIEQDGIYRFWVYRNVESGGVDPAKIIHLQLELSPIATAYEPYSGNQYTLQLGQTVYGGTLDVTNGVLTVDRAIVDMGTLAWGYNSDNGYFYVNLDSKALGNFNLICSCYATTTSITTAGMSDKQIKGSSSTKNIYVKDSVYTDAATFTTAMSGVQLVYELATPIEIPLTATQISTLAGQNVLWADAGDVTVEYLASGGVNADLMKLAVAFMGRK